MSKALILLAGLLLAASCRPSADRVDADQARGSATTEITDVPGSGRANRGNGDPVKDDAENATPETLPTREVVAPPPAPSPTPPAPSPAAGPRPDTPPTGNAVAEANEVEARPTPEQAAPVNARIPAEYRGRWGMVPADCTSTRGDAKGLITIGDRQIRFYEATATLTEVLPSDPGRFTGAFSHSGEGQSWQTVTSFVRQGDTLTRTEGEQGFSYMRCR